MYWEDFSSNGMEKGLHSSHALKLSGTEMGSPFCREDRYLLLIENEENSYPFLEFDLSRSPIQSAAWGQSNLRSVALT